jgi:hypothetical protein
MTSNQEDRPIDLQGGEQSYEELLEEYSNPLPEAEAGEVLQGHVLQVTDTGVIVMGLKRGVRAADQVWKQTVISPCNPEIHRAMLDRRRHYEGVHCHTNGRAKCGPGKPWKGLPRGLVDQRQGTEKVKAVECGRRRTAFMPSSQREGGP